MKEIYVTADLHLSHNNIVKGISKWINNKYLRNFSSVEEMNQTIISNIQKTVKRGDDLYILGDLYFGKDVEYVCNLLKIIDCNLILILGNHDYLIKKNIDLFKDIFQEIHFGYNELRLKYPLKNQDPNLDKWKGRQLITMSHYGHRVWNGSGRDSWHLYGHSHFSMDDPEKKICNIKSILDAFNEYTGLEVDLNKFKEFYNTNYNGILATVEEHYLNRKTMDVGLESAYYHLGEYRPFNFFEIKEILDKRDTLKIDHH